MSKHPDNEDFKEWLDFLKKKASVKFSTAGIDSGIGSSRVQNIRLGRTQASKSDFKKLVIAYPILKEKAKALGIDPYPTAPSEVMHLSEPQAEYLSASMLADIRQAVDEKDREIAYLRAENARLLSIIEQLTAKL